MVAYFVQLHLFSRTLLVHHSSSMPTAIYYALWVLLSYFQIVI